MLMNSAWHFFMEWIK